MRRGEMLWRAELKQEDAPRLAGAKWPERPRLRLDKVLVEALRTQFLFVPRVADFLGVFDSPVNRLVQRFRKELLQEARAIVDFFQGTFDLLGACH
jgi:hypothetical protein